MSSEQKALGSAEAPAKPEEKKEEPKKGSSLSEELNASSDRIRETAKWLVATFGAIAGALIVGLQLSDIGQLEGADQVAATIAAFAALVAVIMIVALATVVLARPRVPLGELSSNGSGKYKRLREALDRNRSLYAGFTSVSKLVDKVEEEWAKQFNAWSVKNKSNASAEERALAEKEFEETKKVLPELNMLIDRLMSYARAEDLRLVFERVRNAIIALAIVVALGGVVFAFVNDAPEEEETPAVSQRPVAARLDLSTTGQEKMGASLGAECDLDRVPVLVMSSSESSSEVVSIAAEGCSTARLTLETEDGELQAFESVALPAPDEEKGDEGLDPPPG
jgi:hypothetical protein